MIDLSNITIEGIILGITSIIVSWGVISKKLFQDRLDVTKSATERELIVLLREELQRLNDELTKLKVDHSALEKKHRKISNERDDAIREKDLLANDKKRLEQRITDLDVIVNKLNTALEIATNKFNDENDDTDQSN